MRIVDLNHCPKTDRAVVLLQEESRDRWLAFYVPMNEANRLARALGLTPCSCTPVFDLAEHLIGELGATVLRAELDADQRGITATLVLARGRQERPVPCHPADAMALALRARAPIVATAAALAHARPAGPPPAADAVREWLDQVRPGDFAGGAA
jgi:bifunctional DNase/RNase